ncbi:MAG: hypothetical protein C0467_21975 [Planctomycetaceae bacterium]|nr:hypothetical protein [Planctomycetaceae bacterium]
MQLTVVRWNRGRDAVDTFISRYDRIDPLRPAAFRWARAQRLFLLGDRLDPRWDDQLTALVLDYQQTLGGTDCPLVCPAPRFRLIHRAHRIYAENGETRWELEARLLAGQSDQEISRRVGLPRGLVAVYHDSFCTCRDRLRASDCILVTFIGRGPMVGFAPGDIGGVWKWVGYFTGPYMLDVLIAATSKQTRRHAYTEDALESARRFVLMAQIPVTARFASLATIVGMIDETEQRAAPPEPSIGPSLAVTSGAGDRPITPDRLPQLRLGRGLGKSRTCGAMPWASTGKSGVGRTVTSTARFG